MILTFGLLAHGYVRFNFFPSIDGTFVTASIEMSDGTTFAMTERVAEQEGLFVGHSAGANVAAALRIGKQLSEAGESGVVVTVLCDRGDRYFGRMVWEKHYVW